MRPLILTLALILIAGCSLNPTPPPPAAGPQPAVAAPSPTAPPANTPSPMPPSPGPAPSATPQPTATPIPHPMEIQAMRRADYPGSDILLEQELDPGANYRRFYASYLSEGLKIFALLTIPNGDPPPGGWPAIVFNHGYIPPDVYRTTERYVAYVDRLAQAGYMVFRIDYRGHDRSEGAPTGAYGSPGYTVDVLNALASLKRYPLVNPEKLGMWGHSMGGFLTLRAMVISQDVKAGVIWAGVVGSYTDLLYNWRRGTAVPTPAIPTTARRWRNEWLQTYGTPEDNPAFWNSISANAFLSDLSGPVQLHHGTADADVPLAFSETLSLQAQAAGKPVELYVYEGDNHNLSGYFTQAMNRTIEFYDRYLKP